MLAFEDVGHSAPDIVTATHTLDRGFLFGTALDFADDDAGIVLDGGRRARLSSEDLRLLLPEIVAVQGPNNAIREHIEVAAIGDCFIEMAE